MSNRRLANALAVKAQYILPTCFSRLSKKTGLTKEQYLTMLAAQGGVCAICKLRCVRALAVDHCHTTGKIRGLLCLRCNTALGLFKDEVTVLMNAVGYVSRSLSSPKR